MRRWTKIGGAAALGLAAGAAVALAVAGRRWDRATARTLERLDGTAPRPAPGGAETSATYAPHELTALPPPVARYFAFALTPGQPLVRRARLTQDGEFAMQPGAWRPFRATEHFAVRPPGFVWDARIRLAPLVAVHVRDGYLEHAGTMRGAIAGLVPVVDQHDTPAMATGALLRYLAEAAWLPTALLPASGVEWTPLDEHSARATLADGPTTVSLDVHFGPLGEIDRVRAVRPRETNGTLVPTRWEGTFGDYERIDGMMVPRRGEVGWVIDGKLEPYWRGRIAEAEYQY